MTEVEILRNLQVLCEQFISYDDNWRRLKCQKEFAFGVNHNSPIRDMYAEGSGCAFYLKNSLNTFLVNKNMLVDEYVEGVKKAIPPRQDYEAIGQAAQLDFNANYSTNYTIQCMLNQYWEQWETVKRVEQFLSALIKTSAHQPLVRSSPIQVIRQYVKNWEQDAQLHKNHSETALRAQLVVALRSAGFEASAETHSFQGHADIIVSKTLIRGVVVIGYQLVAECKIWNGSAALSAALSQLCQYVTPNDSHAALIVFVNNGSFNDICRKAAQSLVEHKSCRVSLGGVDYIEYFLRPAQNPSLEIPASLLLCNLTIPRYPR